MGKSKINRQQLAFEFLSVVFAVLLALLLNSWRESAAKSRTLAKVQQTIRTEIMHNDQILRPAMVYRANLINELYTDTHLINQVPVNAIPIDVTDDRQLEQFIKEIAPFAQSKPVTYVKVQSNGDKRIVSINDLTMTVRIVDDTLKVYGASNIVLRSADIGNRSWEIAKATGVLVDMDLELVDALNQVYNLNCQYLSVSNKALDMVYKGEHGIRSVLEDMYSYEVQIIKADSLLLKYLAD